MKVSQTASNRHFRSALRAGVGCGDVTALSCFIFDPMCHLCFSGEPTYETGYGTRQIRLICEWDLGLTCLADPHRLEKILPSPTSHKNGPTGAGMERGVVSLLRLQKPHTGPYRRGCGGDSFLLLPVFIISPFSGPVPKVFFFVYAAQFLYKSILPFSPPNNVL